MPSETQLLTSLSQLFPIDQPIRSEKFGLRSNQLNSTILVFKVKLITLFIYTYLISAESNLLLTFPLIPPYYKLVNCQLFVSFVSIHTLQMALYLLYLYSKKKEKLRLLSRNLCYLYLLQFSLDFENNRKLTSSKLKNIYIYLVSLILS